MWSPVIAQQLRQRGFDVVAVVERLDLRTQADEVIFATAQAEERAIVTENVPDFRRITTEAFQHGIVHRGLILSSNRRFPRGGPRLTGKFINALLELLDEVDDLSGIERWLG